MNLRFGLLLIITCNLLMHSQAASIHNESAVEYLTDTTDSDTSSTLANNSSLGDETTSDTFTTVVTTSNEETSSDTTVISDGDITTNVAISNVVTENLENEFDSENYIKINENRTKRIEARMKSIIKGAVKNYLPTLMEYNSDAPISTKCTSSLMKYIAGLTSVKVWAIKMLDSTSKPPSGVFAGVMSEFGDFDECLAVELPRRNGQLEFRGQYCALEGAPLMGPIPKNFSMAYSDGAHPLESIGAEIKMAGKAFHYMKFRFGVCVPSTCSLEDMQIIAKRISKVAELDVTIPKCYVKEDVVFQPIHIVVILFIAALIVAGIFGTVIEHQSAKFPANKSSTFQEVFKCFSIPSNFNRLFAASKGQDLKALNGLRVLSMAWVLMGHTYVWVNFHLQRGVDKLPRMFHHWDFEAIINGWLAVEGFVFLSGFLTCYAVMNIMPKTKGRLNVPIYVLRRYIRLLPPLLLTIGLAYFMPLVSSGPFFYERIDQELRACSNYWWRSILFISNWGELQNICLHTTWYLSADFQLHIISAGVLYILYKRPKLGLGLIGALILTSSIIIGVLTYLWDLPPVILISSGNSKKIQETIDIVHTKTFTHAGPYLVGVVFGYMMVKHKGIKLSKMAVTCGWLASIVTGIVTVYGAHPWNDGQFPGMTWTLVFATLHRTLYTIAVGWVVFACITGYGGPVNKILSCYIMAPLGRLTFMIYLMHALVIWVRKASMRERPVFAHFDLLYEYAGSIIFTLILTIPFYLLLEAPLANLERLMFSRIRLPKDETDKHTNGHVTSNAENGVKELEKSVGDGKVELKAIKSLEGKENNGFAE